MRHHRGATLIALAIAAAAALATLAGPAARARTGPARPAGGAAGAGGIRARAGRAQVSPTPSTTLPYWACPRGTCEAIVEPRSHRASGHWALPAGGPQLEGSGEEGGYDPQDLQSAYKIPTSEGSTQTIALIDAYGFSAAEQDLNTYRERYGLEPCTQANGCFKQVNEQGEEGNYPSPPSGENEGWVVETALDLDMASAACPHCHILLVQATTEAPADTAEAVNTAAKLGATEISNSYSYPEEYQPSCGTDGCEQYSSDYHHAGVLVTAAAGDSGYNNDLEGFESAGFPATSPYVVSVGGTSLRKAVNSRGWSEEVWSEPQRGLGTGSGCSAFEPKPSSQTDGSCASRTDNDIAAVAACETPVSIYIYWLPRYPLGWADVCGTSVGAPLVAGIEAHATDYARSLGAAAFYKDPGALFDVTAGSDGACTPPAQNAYLCNAAMGWDGPSGNGTPDGPLALASAPPSAATRPASAVSTGAATLDGLLDPSGLPTTYRFEYGRTTSYGASVPVPDASAGSGSTDQQVSEAIGGLQADATYHYRLIATNSAGTSVGEDKSFVTASPAVVGVEPDSGPAGGGTSVTIHGAHLAGATEVRFGSTAAKGFKVESETSITATAPPGPGPVDVTVSTPAGTSPTGTADHYTYIVGPVLSWGWGIAGDLGDGAALNRFAPVEPTGLRPVRAIAAGFTFNLALTQKGTVMAWGSNEYEQLGDNSTASSDAPIKVCAVGVFEQECPGGPYLEGVTSIAAGWDHALALRSDGAVLTWGEGWSSPTPVCVATSGTCTPEHYLKEVVAISGGGLHSLALLKDGTVMAWGYNAYGELGDGTTAYRYGAVHVCVVAEVPCKPEHYLKEVATISAGGYHSAALLKNGTVMAWGHDYEGELGNGKSEEVVPVPVRVCAPGVTECPAGPYLEGVTSIAAGSGHSLALLKDHSLVAWGANIPFGSAGVLGNGTFEDSFVPVKVCAVGATGCTSGPYLEEVKAIAAGAQLSMALLKDGTVVSWGENEVGELGDGRIYGEQQIYDGVPVSAVPVKVCAAGVRKCPAGPYLEGISAIASGGLHGIALNLRPVVTGLKPKRGPIEGDTPVTITGSNFTGATAVQFGSVHAASFTVDSRSSITAVSPAEPAGTVNVTVKTPEGTSAISSADRFKFAPIISGLSPTSGPATGGTSVTVSGTGFALGASATSFKFGSTKATEVECTSTTTCTVIAPPHEIGTVDVKATVNKVSSVATASDQFSYE